MARILNLFVQAVAFVFMVPLSVQAFELRYQSQISIEHGLKFQNTVLGGLSGAAYKENTLWMVSDDRGKFGSPRIYGFDFSISDKKITLKPKSLITVKSPDSSESINSLDTEGLALTEDGTFYLSTEGNNNSKPRQMPEIFTLNSAGKPLRSLEIPAKFLPEKTGQQKIGIQNNTGFEGLTISPSQKNLFVATEAPLYQEVLWEGSPLLRILVYNLQEAKSTPKEYAYQVEAGSQNAGGFEVFRGVSAILSLDDQRAIVLERGVRLSSDFKRSYTTALYLADFSEASDISEYESLERKKITLVKKKKILDLETDIPETKSKPIQNFEALSWGPTLPNGKNSLLLISDDNFHKKEITEILLFEVN